jgi:CubicO group peptidase (beta-lactamase class C family)
MSHSTRVIAALALLLPIGLLSRAEPVGLVSVATRSGLQEVDEDSVDAYIRASMHAAHIPGLALGVVHGDHVAYLKGYGVAGPDGRPVTAQTPFILGSTSKSFTALAVMQLVEAGKIDLDAPVTKYLPWFRTRNRAGSAQISVRHLLHHTSGLQTYEGRQGLWDGDQSSVALENGIRELSSAPLRQPAGQRFEYANENYNALGLIVQAVSGISYEDYVRSSIFAPLQMSHSAAAQSDPAAADIASGYRYWLWWPVTFDAPYPRRMTPAGFLISSAEDMAHYVVAQLSGGAYEHRQLLSPSGIVALHTPVSKMGSAISYGMGWAIRSAPGSTAIWHDGEVSNFHSHLRLLPDQRLGIVVLMNVGASGNGAAIDSLVNGIATTLLGHGPAAPTGSLGKTLSRLTVTVPLLVAILWAGWSYRSLRSGQRLGEPNPRGPSRFWRLYLPLAVDLCAVGVIWILVPATAHTPMAAIALFAPDVFAVIVTITGLTVGCAIARTFFALCSRRVIGYACS